MRGINLKSKRVLVRLVVGVLAVVALLGYLVYPKGQDEAAAMVAGYLHALADHDAAAALSYLYSSPTDETWLTDAVLGRAFAEYPLTEVWTASTSSYEVAFSYLLGGSRYSGTTYVQEDSDGDGWKLDNGTTEVTLAHDPSIPLQINGVEAAATKWGVQRGASLTSLSLFPGVYRFSSGLDTVEYLDQPLVIPPLITVEEADLKKLTPSLTRAGVASVAEAATVKLADCLASTEQIPKGCGMPFRWYDKVDAVVHRRIASATTPVETLAAGSPGTLEREVDYIGVASAKVDGEPDSDSFTLSKLWISFGPKKLTVAFGP